jgi:large subunit ribosomal protein L35
MPKMKTKRGAAKRLKKSASGKLRRYKGWKSHLLEAKPPRRRRHLRKSQEVAKADERRMRRLVPYL